MTGRQNATFPSNGTEAHGYLARPATGRGPGVVVIQEWWGLTDYVAGVADRLAAEGFLALAPDLYGGPTTHDGEEAGRLMSALPVERAAEDLAGAVDFLLGHEAVTSDRVGAVGFCMGGGFVQMLAAQQGDRVAAAVPFYGVGPGLAQDTSGLTAAVQGHYAEGDAFYPVQQARELEEALRASPAAEVEFHYYAAGHAFHNDENTLGTYDPVCAELAWSRTVAFLHRYLG